MKIRRIVAPLLLCALSAFGYGCSQDGDMGQVSGTVTLDGQPLPDARVRFVPEGGGRPSSGKTDSAGYYELRYTASQDGAEVGKHRVHVTTGTEEDGKVTTPEKVPVKYNHETELVKEVEPGSQEINLELDSNGPILQPDQVEQLGAGRGVPCTCTCGSVDW